MNLRSNQLALSLVFSSALALAGAHAGSAQVANIDPALLAKANAGDAPAQLQIADIYAAGKIVNQDYQLAAMWYRRAADQGNIQAEAHLAVLYRDGKGVSRDMARAASWYAKAADQGDADAQGTLGVLYSFGQGVPQSDAEAYYWFDLAAQVKGPNQEKYASYRQMRGEHITADELAEVQARVAKWMAAHPRQNPAG